MYEVLNTIREDNYPNSFSVSFDVNLDQKIKTEVVKQYLIKLVQKIIPLENLIHARTLVKVLNQERTFTDQTEAKFTIVKILTPVYDNVKVRKLILNGEYDYCIQEKRFSAPYDMLIAKDYEDIKLELMLR